MDAHKDKIDDDILQCREDILRSADTQRASEKAVPQEPSELMEAVVKANKTSKIEKTEQAEKQSVKPENDSGKSEIPKFDLAKQIIAKQRTISTAKRMGPEANIEPLHKPRQQQRMQQYPHGQAARPTTATPEENRIISEIVARDIERLLNIAG